MEPEHRIPNINIEFYRDPNLVCRIWKKGVAVAGAAAERWTLEVGGKQRDIAVGERCALEVDGRQQQVEAAELWRLKDSYRGCRRVI